MKKKMHWSEIDYKYENIHIYILDSYFLCLKPSHTSQSVFKTKYTLFTFLYKRKAYLKSSNCSYKIYHNFVS